jgi:hypothetical protein
MSAQIQSLQLKLQDEHKQQLALRRHLKAL